MIVPTASGNIVPTAQLMNLGVRRWRLYAGDTTRPLRGVVAAPGVDPASFESRVAAARVIMRDGSFFSRRTAAQLLDLPTFRSGSQLDVGSVRPNKPPSRPELRGHQIRAGVLREEVAGPLWLPHPADVWGLLAGVSALPELVMLGDHLISGRVRHAPPLCRIEELEDTVRRFHNSVGITRLRSALPLLRTGVESPAESLLRLKIIEAGFEEPQTCCPVEVAAGTRYADLGYPELKIAIEFDGAYHFAGGAAQARFDNERIEAMIDAGWRVLRVTAIDLRDPRRFLQRLANAIASATARLRK